MEPNRENNYFEVPQLSEKDYEDIIEILMKDFGFSREETIEEINKN